MFVVTSVGLAVGWQALRAPVGPPRSHTSSPCAADSVATVDTGVDPPVAMDKAVDPSVATDAGAAPPAAPMPADAAAAAARKPANTAATDADHQGDGRARASRVKRLPWNPDVRIEDYRPEHPVEWAVTRSQQRLSENGDIPYGALMNALRQREAMIEAQHGVARRSAARTNGASHRTSASAGVGGLGRYAWTWLGPGNVGGRIRSIVIHPDEPNRMWVGSVSGGLWFSENAGGRWDPVDDFLPNLAITCMVMDPRKSKVMYAGTGEGVFFLVNDGSSNTAAMRGAGIFRSTDGGKTWAQLESTAGPEWHAVARIAISPRKRKTILAANSTGIYRSTDGGSSWTRTFDQRTLDVDFHPTDGNLAVAGRADNVAMYSTDGGVTWTNATGITGGTRVELAYAPTNPDWVYACVSGTNQTLRVWRSTDGGRTYSLRTSGNGFSTLAIYDNALWVDPTNAELIVIGGLDLHRSTNGGVSFTTISQWNQAPRSAHADQHVIVQHPDFDGVNNTTVYFGNDGGIYRADNVYTVQGTNGWQELNNNLGITQFYGAAANADSGVVIAGAQDNGTQLFTGDTEAWRAVIGGDGTYCAADPTDPNYLYGSTQRLNILRSTNGGNSFSGITGGPNPLADRGGLDTNFIPVWGLDPNNENVMYATAARLWRTTNVKNAQPNWFAIKPALNDCPIRPGPPPGQDHYLDNNPCNISTFAVADGDSNVIWVGHNRGDLYVTRNALEQNPVWTRVDTNEPRLPKRWVASIAIDPYHHDRVYVAYMGYEEDNVWRTEDGGQSWQLIVGEGESRLPAAPVTSILIYPTAPGHLYVGTDVGVFASVDDGASWSTSNDGPSSVGVDQLLWKGGCGLLAVTHGRGVFEADICGPCGRIDEMSVRCKRSRVTAKVSSQLPQYDELTFSLDAQPGQRRSIDENGVAKITFRNVAPGTHTVCIDECPALCRKAECE